MIALEVTDQWLYCTASIFAFGASRILLSVPGLQSFGDSSLNIRLVVKTQPGVQWGLARALRKRIKERFDEEGLEIPFL